MKRKTSKPLVINNRRARFDYEFIDTWIAGIQLVGTEVRSLREGRANLTNAYCYIDRGECWLKEMEIHESANQTFQHQPKRLRKLLLRKAEIEKIERSLDKGLTIIPNRVFLKGPYWKAEIVLARGRKNWDKRNLIKERDIDREQKREGK